MYIDHTKFSSSELVSPNLFKIFVFSFPSGPSRMESLRRRTKGVNLINSNKCIDLSKSVS